MKVHRESMEEIEADLNEIIEKNSKYIDYIDEWLKWLKYYPSFEVVRMNKICKNARSSNLTDSDLNYVKKYTARKHILKLLKKYKSGKCTKKDIWTVHQYFKTNSLDNLIIEKLSLSELKEARAKIDRYKDMPDDEKKEELSDYIEKFDEISMVDACALRSALSSREISNKKMK